MKAIIAMLATMALATAALAAGEPEVWVGHEIPAVNSAAPSAAFDPPAELVGGPAFEPLTATTWAGYECREYAHGCPVGAVIVVDGNIDGCRTIGSPPTTCTGSCVACNGGSTSTSICARKATSSCEVPGGLGSTTECGFRGNSLCGFAPPPAATADPQGCTCPPPTAYGTDKCKIATCVADA